MKYLFLSFSLILLGLQLNAQNYTIEEGPVSKVKSARFEKPLLLQNTAKSKLVAIYVHEERGKDNIMLYETDNISNKCSEKAKYVIKENAEFLNWFVLNGNLFVLIAHDSTGKNYFASKKAIIALLIDKDGKEVCRRNFGVLAKHTLGLSVSRNQKHLVFNLRSPIPFNPDEEADENDYIWYCKLNVSNLQTIADAEIQVEKDEINTTLLLSDNGIIYHVFCRARVDYLYKEIDLVGDKIADYQWVFREDEGAEGHCAPFLLDQQIAFAGSYKYKGKYTIYTKIQHKDSDGFVTSSYELTEEDVSLLYSEYADPENKTQQITRPIHLRFEEGINTASGTFLIFQSYNWNRYHFYNNLFVLKVNDKLELNKVDIIHKRVNSTCALAGYRSGVIKDSLKIFFYEFNPRYKVKVQGLYGHANPFYYASDYSDMNRIVCVSINTKSPDKKSVTYYTPKFVSKGFMLEWKYLTFNQDNTLTGIADLSNSFKLVSLSSN